MQHLCDDHVAEDVDLDFKSQDAYTANAEGLDELAKDVTALANARGGLIVVGIAEDSQGCADKLSLVPVSDKKVTQMTGGLRARIVPYLPDVSIRTVEDAPGSGKGFILISVPGSALAPHAVRMTTRPSYSFARRVGRTTAWLEESEIAALYRDRFRLAAEHREKVAAVLRKGMEWRAGSRPEMVWLDLALVPSVPAERFVDAAHIDQVRAFLGRFAEDGAAPTTLARSFAGQMPVLLRGRLRIDKYDGQAAELHADGSVFARVMAAWPRAAGGPPVMNFTMLEITVLSLLHFAAAYADWAGAYGDVDVLARLTGPSHVIPDRMPLDREHPLFSSDAVARSSDEPAHRTSTLGALASDGAQLQDCARRISADFLADLGVSETTLLKDKGHILTDRFNEVDKAVTETWMKHVGLPVG